MQFRKAKALAGVGYTEKAIKILEDLVSKNPDGACSGRLVDCWFTISLRLLDALFKSELAAVRIKDKEAEKKSYGKFRGGFRLGRMVRHRPTPYDKIGFMGTKPNTIQVNEAASSSSPNSNSEPKIEEIS
jgi:hypothetical protein